MIQVDLYAMNNYKEELTLIKNRIKIYHQEISGIISGLDGCFRDTRIWNDLFHEEALLYEQINKLDKMIKSIEEIINVYSIFEHRVMDRGDSAFRVKRPIEIAMMDTAYLNDMLGEMFLV